MSERNNVIDILSFCIYPRTIIIWFISVHDYSKISAAKVRPILILVPFTKNRSILHLQRKTSERPICFETHTDRIEIIIWTVSKREWIKFSWWRWIRETDTDKVDIFNVLKATNRCKWLSSLGYIFISTIKWWLCIDSSRYPKSLVKCIPPVNHSIKICPQTISASKMQVYAIDLY